MTQEKLIIRALSFIVKLLWNIFVDIRRGQVPAPLLHEGNLLAADMEIYLKQNGEVKPS